MDNENARTEAWLRVLLRAVRNREDQPFLPAQSASHPAIQRQPAGVRDGSRFRSDLARHTSPELAPRVSRAIIPAPRARQVPVQLRGSIRPSPAAIHDSRYTRAMLLPVSAIRRGRELPCACAKADAKLATPTSAH